MEEESSKNMAQTSEFTHGMYSLGLRLGLGLGYVGLGFGLGFELLGEDCNNIGNEMILSNENHHTLLYL
ncbi:unnamed protein product [Rhizophagus irregularis]|nr:unnamed protein product [Rhizophagus irregularis]